MWCFAALERWGPDKWHAWGFELSPFSNKGLRFSDSQAIAESMQVEDCFQGLVFALHPSQVCVLLF
jgi:hypothetical protein